MRANVWVRASATTGVAGTAATGAVEAAAGTLGIGMPAIGLAAALPVRAACICPRSVSIRAASWRTSVLTAAVSSGVRAPCTPACKRSIRGPICWSIACISAASACTFAGATGAVVSALTGATGTATAAAAAGTAGDCCASRSTIKSSVFCICPIWVANSATLGVVATGSEKTVVTAGMPPCAPTVFVIGAMELMSCVGVGSGAVCCQDGASSLALTGLAYPPTPSKKASARTATDTTPNRLRTTVLLERTWVKDIRLSSSLSTAL